jgi:hypothetical protein
MTISATRIFGKSFVGPLLKKLYFLKCKKSAWSEYT